jgi:hypothetical protein
MKRMSQHDLLKLRDTFADIEGNPATAPVIEDKTDFAIIAGPWPNANFGAIKVQCKMCGRPAGISPKGFALHQENPERTIVCSACFVRAQNMLAGAEEGPCH